MQYKNPDFYKLVEARYFFIFQDISGATNFLKKLWAPFFKLYHGLFIKKKSGTLQCLFGLELIKNLTFLYERADSL